MALILPKGIIVNSPDIAGAIDKIHIEPLDRADIFKVWKVYTTTRRRLLDPTAERLENFWWRILGSQRRELNGATIAKLFTIISDAQSFVPLQGPTNRDEGTRQLKTPIFHRPGAASTTTPHHLIDTSSSTTSRKSALMPPSILKRAGRPSKAGSRPTTRFVSPLKSEAKADANSTVSPKSHVLVQPSSSSHNSQSSRDDATKVNAQGTNHSSAEEKFSEQPHKKEETSFKVQENFSPDRLIAQSSRERHSLKSSDSVRDSPQIWKEFSEERTSEVVALRQPVPPKLRPMRIEQSRAENLTHELKETELQQMLLNEANRRVQNSPPTLSQRRSNGIEIEELSVPQISLRMTSEGSQEQDMGAIRLTQDVKTAAGLTLIPADTVRQIDLGDTSRNLLRQATGAKGEERDPDEVQQIEMFAKRQIPPIWGKGSPVRGKSELTLLLQNPSAR